MIITSGGGSFNWDLNIKNSSIEISEIHSSQTDRYQTYSIRLILHVHQLVSFWHHESKISPYTLSQHQSKIHSHHHLMQDRYLIRLLWQIDTKRWNIIHSIYSKSINERNVERRFYLVFVASRNALTNTNHWLTIIIW